MKEQVKQLWEQGKGQRQIARETGVARSTIQGWIKEFKNATEPEDSKPSETELLRDKIKQLESSIASIKKENLSDHYVREAIINIAKNTPEPPTWLLEGNGFDDWEATPTIFLSDLHWGEVVDPKQIGNTNAYDLDIAKERLKSVVDTSCRLLDMVDGSYPGIVVALGGDMLSGDIHEELSESNAMPMMPVLLDLYENMIAVITAYADKYDNVFVPCVTGNHSRTTKKPRAKARNYTNFDWLLYCLLERYFQNDERVVFQIPEGPDALFKVYNTRYLLTHGDQFRGGDGMIGALGPIIRGDHKKRSRNGQIDMVYDCMLLGHWHQLIQMQRLIVNGSLKGMDEYAFAGNFGYEQPRQALWLTHPEHGIIMSMPVNADRHFDESKYQDSDWVSWKT